MKKSVLALFIFLKLAGYNCFSEDYFKFDILGNSYVIDCGIKSFFTGIDMKEYVYAGENVSDKVSEIAWNVNYGFAEGMDIIFRPDNIYRKFGLSVETGFLWYFPSGTGNVKDEDWDYYGNKYSEALCGIYFNGGVEVGGNITFGFPFGKNVLLSVGAGVWYSRFMSKAVDGIIYQVSAGEDWGYREGYNLYGVSMEYIQEWFVVNPVIRLDVGIDKFSFNLGFSFSPWIWSYNVDFHYFKKMDESDYEQKYVTYEDNLKGGKYIDFNAGIYYRVLNNVNVCLYFGLKSVGESRGDTMEKTAGLAGYKVTVKGMSGGDILVKKFGIKLIFAM